MQYKSTKREQENYSETELNITKEEFLLVTSIIGASIFMLTPAGPFVLKSITRLAADPNIRGIIVSLLKKYGKDGVKLAIPIILQQLSSKSRDDDDNPELF